MAVPLPLRHHKVLIQAVGSNPAAGTEFEAYLRDSISFRISMGYDTIFREIIDIRNILNKTMVGIEEFTRGGMMDEVSNYFNKIVASGIRWTRKVGGIPEHLEFTIPCRIWVEGSRDDIMSRLKLLYDIAVPEMGANITVLPQRSVSVAIGTWFLMENAYVTKVNHVVSEAMVWGTPAYMDLDIDVTSVYVVDKKVIDFIGNKIVVTDPERAGREEEGEQEGEVE